MQNVEAGFIGSKPGSPGFSCRQMGERSLCRLLFGSRATPVLQLNSSLAHFQRNIQRHPVHITSHHQKRCHGNDYRDCRHHEQPQLHHLLQPRYGYALDRPIRYQCVPLRDFFFCNCDCVSSGNPPPPDPIIATSVLIKCPLRPPLALKSKRLLCDF